MKQRPTRHLYLVPRAALRKMTSQNYPMGSKMNSDDPQRTLVCPSRSQDAWYRVNNSHFSYTKNTVKKMNYGHWTGCNLLQTDADGIISPDILLIVHKAKGKSIYLKEILPQRQIKWFQKGSVISRNWVNTAVLCGIAQTWHSYLVPRAALRKMTSRNCPMGSNMNSDGPQRTQVYPLWS